MSDSATSIIQSNDGITADVRSMIQQTREGIARVVNSGIALLYWRIGKRIQTEILGHERAEYGKEILATLSQQLTDEFGKGYSYSALTRMVKFAEAFSEGEIVATLSRQLGWSHFKEIFHPLHFVRTKLEAKARETDKALREILGKIGV